MARHDIDHTLGDDLLAGLQRSLFEAAVNIEDVCAALEDDFAKARKEDAIGDHQHARWRLLVIQLRQDAVQLKFSCNRMSDQEAEVALQHLAAQAGQIAAAIEGRVQ